MPVDVIIGIKLAGKTALFNVPDSATPLQSFSAIHQGVVEPFIKFVDCLREAIERQIDNVESGTSYSEKWS